MAFEIRWTAGARRPELRLERDRLQIGRGTDADLRLDDDTVDLSHAELRLAGGELLLIDGDSAGGTYLNGRLVETERVASGDRIGIGPFEIRVELAGEDARLWVTSAAVPADGSPAQPPARIDYAAAYGLRRAPLLSKSALAVAAFTLAALAALVATVATWTGRSQALAPGGLSTAHAAAGANVACASCHAPFRGAVSSRCEACHQGPEHQARQVTAPDCAGCHVEHVSDARLARVPDASCTSCHAKLEVAGGGEPRVAREVRGFDEHPAFRRRADETPLRLNHALHLKPGLRGPAGAVQLTCESCHAYDAAAGEIQPVTFDAHCRSCHDLAFDDRLPEEQAPHTTADRVVAHLFGVYARDRDLLARLTPAEQRRLIFGGSVGGLSFDERTRRLAFTAADHLLRLRCTLCHEVELNSPVEARVEPVRLPESWFTAARFEHGPHRTTPCEDCHRDAATSRRTADLLVPAIETCNPCHASDAEAARRVPTTCATCHLYHEKSKTGWEVVSNGGPP